MTSHRPDGRQHPGVIAFRLKGRDPLLQIVDFGHQRLSEFLEPVGPGRLFLQQPGRFIPMSRVLAGRAALASPRLAWLGRDIAGDWLVQWRTCPTSPSPSPLRLIGESFEGMKTLRSSRGTKDQGMQCLALLCNGKLLWSATSFAVTFWPSEPTGPRLGRIEEGFVQRMLRLSKNMRQGVLCHTCSFVTRCVAGWRVNGLHGEATCAPTPPSTSSLVRSSFACG